VNGMRRVEGVSELQDQHIDGVPAGTRSSRPNEEGEAQRRQEHAEEEAGGEVRCRSAHDRLLS